MPARLLVDLDDSAGAVLPQRAAAPARPPRRGPGRLRRRPETPAPRDRQAQGGLRRHRRPPVRRRPAAPRRPEAPESRSTATSTAPRAPCRATTRPSTSNCRCCARSAAAPSTPTCCPRATGKRRCSRACSARCCTGGSACRSCRTSAPGSKKRWRCPRRPASTSSAPSWPACSASWASAVGHEQRAIALRQQHRFTDLTHWFEREQPWERQLNALINLQPAVNVEVVEESRLVWLIRHDPHLGVQEIEPREQKRDAQGALEPRPRRSA